jgi:hypothetical protein
LLLGLVAMLIIDVHEKWTAGSAGPLASGARFSSRHCKGAPATHFPPLQMTSKVRADKKKTDTPRVKNKNKNGVFFLPSLFFTPGASRQYI